jgi:hypothetical protein
MVMPLDMVHDCAAVTMAMDMVMVVLLDMVMPLAMVTWMGEGTCLLLDVLNVDMEVALLDMVALLLAALLDVDVVMLLFMVVAGGEVDMHKVLLHVALDVVLDMMASGCST